MPQIDGYKIPSDCNKYPYWTVYVYDDAIDHFAKDEILLEHKIIPEMIIMKKDKFERLIKTGQQIDFTEWDELETKILDEYFVASDAVEKKGVLAPGFIFTVGVADGSGYYIITKINRKTAEVMQLKFIDGYMDQFLGKGRKLSLKDLEVFTFGFGKSR